MTTLIESNGAVSLYRNSDGTFSAVEGGNSTFIKDYGNPATPTRISNIVAAEYLNGTRIVVFDGGHTWYVDNNWQKAPVGPNGADTTNLTTEQYNALIGGGTPVVPVVPVVPSAPTYALTTSSPSVNEGEIANFIVTTTNVADGTLLNYTLGGTITAADIVGGSLSGSVRIDASGRGVISIGIAADAMVEATEALNVRLNINGLTAGIAVNDMASGVPTTRTLIESNGAVSLYRNSDGTFSAVEGGNSTFIKDYGNPATPTRISNIVAAEYLNGTRIVVFDGGHTWYVDNNWQKAPVGPNGADTTNLTTEQYNALIGGGTPVVPVVPVVPSAPTYALTTSSPSVNEGEIANFIVTTTNVADGTLLNYTLGGTITAADIVGGSLSGSVRIDASGRGVISIGIAADAMVEATEALNVRLNINGLTAGIAVNDMASGVPTTRTLIESNGAVSLYRNSDGTFSAVEGGNSTFIKDYGNPATPTRISNIVAAEYLNGTRIVVFDGGHTWYVDNNWQKAPVGPNGADTTNLTTEQYNALIGGGTPVVPVPAQTLIESLGTVSLYRNSDGTFEAKEGANSTLIKDYGNPPTPTRISDIVAAEFLNGQRIVVFGNGHSWYVDSNWQKAPVGPNGADVINLTPAQFASLTGGASTLPEIIPPTLVRSLIESNGAVSLHRNSDGTFSATENGVATFIKDYGYPPVPTKIPNIIAADYYNGYRVVVFSGGHTWYVDSNWQKARVGPNGADTTNLTPQQIAELTGGSASNPVAPEPLFRKLIEGNGTVSLFGNSNGTFSAFENGNYTFIKDYGNPATPTYISNIVAVDYYNGHRVVVFSSGHAWYVDSNWQKAPVGPNGADVINFSAEQLAQFLGDRGSYVPPAPVMRSIVESSGTISLYRNSDGTFSALENGTLTTIKDYGPADVPTQIPNIIAADYYNGYRVVVFSGGHTWYVDSNWQKAPVGPNGADTTNLSAEQIRTFIGNALPVDNIPSYSISPSRASIQEGEVATFNLATSNVAPGTVVNYALMGVAATDVTTGNLAGSVTVDANGGGVITIPTSVDPAMGNKLLSISLSVSGNIVSRSIVISDQNVGPITIASPIDKAVITKPSSEFQLNVAGSSVELLPSNNQEVPRVLNNIDRLEFSDIKLALDTAPTESAGQAALLLGAVLPEMLALDASKQELLGAVINLFDQGFSIQALSGAVLRLPIWEVLTGKAGPSKADIATYLITNVYDTPDAGTLQGGIAAMSAEAVEGEFLANLALSAAAQARIGLAGIQTTGLVYL